MLQQSNKFGKGRSIMTDLLNIKSVIVVPFYNEINNLSECFKHLKNQKKKSNEEKLFLAFTSKY